MIQKISALIALCLLVVSCSMNELSTTSFQNEAVIIGKEHAKCNCCGDWLIEIDGIFLNFKELPRESNIDLETARLPLDVHLSWSPDMDACENFIIIESITVNSRPNR